MNADPRVMEFFPSTLTADQTADLARRKQQHFADHGFGSWVLEIPGQVPFVGYVGLQIPNFTAHFTPCVEVGWRLAFEYWGHGYAWEAAHHSLKHGFGELGLSEIVSFTTVRNLRSRAVMERLGMRRDPKDDFDLPGLTQGHPIGPHVLYRIAANDFGTQQRP